MVRKKNWSWLEESLKDVKNGRTYLWSCVDKKGICGQSGEKAGICHSCCTRECKKWYRLGLKDGARREAEKPWKIPRSLSRRGG